MERPEVLPLQGRPEAMVAVALPVVVDVGLSTKMSEYTGDWKEQRVLAIKNLGKWNAIKMDSYGVKSVQRRPRPRPRQQTQ